MAFWKLCKNGTLLKNKKGELVDREDYEEIVKENKFLRGNLDLDKFALMVCYLLENPKYNLESMQQLALNIYFNSLAFAMRNIIQENEVKNDKEREK